MSDEQKPGDPADKVADGAFGGVQSHRAGYGDDKLARLIGWLRAHPTATLASGEGALLLGEMDRWHAAILDSMDHYTDARAEIDRLREQLRDTDTKVFHLEEKLAWVERERDQLTSLPAERILAALREPSDAMLMAAKLGMEESWPLRQVAIPADWYARALEDAVTAAEKEVEG